MSFFDKLSQACKNIGEKIKSISDTEFPLIVELIKILCSDIKLIAKITPSVIGIASKASKMKSLTDNEQKSDNIADIVEIVMTFRKENPQDFNKVIDMADDCLTKYRNDSTFKEKIVKVLDKYNPPKKTEEKF